MGGFHTLNFALKHPDIFTTAIALSGVYDIRFFTGDYYNDLAVYFNSPIDYLPSLKDPWFIDHYRQNTYITCVTKEIGNFLIFYKRKICKRYLKQKSCLLGLTIGVKTVLMTGSGGLNRSLIL